MLCRAKLSSVSQVGLDAATDSVLFFPTGGVSFCSGVDRARGSFGEPKVTPPFLVYTLSDVTSRELQQAAEDRTRRARARYERVKVPRSCPGRHGDESATVPEAATAQAHRRRFRCSACPWGTSLVDGCPRTRSDQIGERSEPKRAE